MTWDEKLLRCRMHPYLEGANVLERSAPVNPDGARAVAKLKPVVEALRPFADAVEECGIDETDPQKISVWEHPIAQLVSVEDFMRAAAALRSLEEDQ